MRITNVRRGDGSPSQVFPELSWLVTLSTLCLCVMIRPASAGHWRIVTAGKIDSSNQGHEEWTEDQRYADEGAIGMSGYSGQVISDHDPTSSSCSIDFTARLIWFPDDNNFINDPPPNYALVASQRSSIVTCSAFSAPAQDYRGLLGPGVAKLEPDIPGEGNFVNELDSTAVEEDRREQIFSWGKSETKLIFVNNPDRNAAVLVGSISSSAGNDNPPVPGQNDTVQVFVTSECHALFSLVEPSIQAWRKNSGSANIAAGGFDNDLHKADVKLQVGSAVVPAQYFKDLGELTARIRVRMGKGLKRSAQFVPKTPVPNGVGLIVGELTSSDKAKAASKQVVVKLRLSGGPSDPAATVYQRWNDYEKWSAQPDGTGAVPNTFAYSKLADENGQEDPNDPAGVPLTFFHSLEGNPVPGHTMDFLLEQAYVTTWDPQREIYETEVHEDLGGNEFDSPTAGFANFNPKTVTADGSYSTTMKVPYDARKLVAWVKPVAEDHITYKVP